MKKLFSILLILIAVHSIVVGILLIFLPAQYMPFFGFEFSDANFFRAQGGVFHIIMSIVYICAANSFIRYSAFVIVTVSAKIIATLFLIIYFFTVQPIWTIAASGAFDFIMGLTVWLLYSYLKRTHQLIT